MPNQADLTEIANLLYDKPINASGWTENLTYNGNKASQYGLPEPIFYVWSGEEYGTYGGSAYSRYFDTTFTHWGIYGNRDFSSHVGLCLGE